MNLRENIALAESKWLSFLKDYLAELFSEQSLPSHDLQHHLRVWNYGKDLLLNLEQAGRVLPDEKLAESLLLACMLHDAGMSRDRGPGHGKISAGIAADLMNLKAVEAEVNDMVLEAIELHDDKSYLQGQMLTDKGKLNLLAALNIADDLDAMGITGVYRYAEIYLARGIPMEELGLQVIANLSSRFNNFMKHCGRIPAMVITHSPRQHATESFFRNYNYQLRKISEGKSSSMEGPVNVIRLIYRFVAAGMPGIGVLLEQVSGETDPFTINFYNQLKNEL